MKTTNPSPILFPFAFAFDVFKCNIGSSSTMAAAFAEAGRSVPKPGGACRCRAAFAEAGRRLPKPGGACRSRAAFAGGF
ncbi:MAG: hypothetical protein PHW77_05855 [Eubacteriales bacterium]|nr:hypothetical protein [Eubacteriales bacterium]